MGRSVPLVFSLLVASLGAGVALAEPVERPGDIDWAADARLRWQDFQGPVDPSASSERVAMTAASLSWGYTYGLERGDEYCVYRIVDIDIRAIFNRKDSWAKPGHLTDRVLEHEQGHFDITQLFKLKLEESASELLSERWPCEGASIGAASNYAERGAGRIVSALGQKIWREHVAAQEAYDDQTRHGTVPDAQQAWLEAIGRGIDTGRWRSIEALLD